MHAKISKRLKTLEKSLMKTTVTFIILLFIVFVFINVLITSKANLADAQ